MPKFDAVQAKILISAVGRFLDALNVELAEPVATLLRGYAPPELDERRRELELIRQQLTLGEGEGSVHDIHAPLLKAVVAHQRRTLAAEIDEPRRRTGDRGAIRYLEKELRVLDGVVHASWFCATTAARLPRVTDYLSLRVAEQALGEAQRLRPRAYDEKFQILEAPALFVPDLAAYRTRCMLRRVDVCVVFVDIDDFKAFNTRYGETRVDRDLLPAFMGLLEAHTFAHGHAYRFGGDEYVLLLPNCRVAEAVGLLRRFQAALRELSLPGIETSPSISAGVCAVGPDCILTDREALERANQAKNHAKAHGKDGIASYRGELFADSDLTMEPVAGAEP